MEIYSYLKNNNFIFFYFSTPQSLIGSFKIINEVTNIKKKNNEHI